MRFSLAFLLAASLFFLSCSKFTRLQKRGTLEQKYEAANKYFNEGKFYKASLLYEEIIPLMRGTSQAEKAQFYYAYCQYNIGNLVLAAYYFKQFYTTYPRSVHAQEAKYMLAETLRMDSPEYYLDQENTVKAINAYQEFINAYPNSDKLAEANRYIDELRDKLEYKDYKNARLYAKTYKYESALVAFGNFSKNWPDSELNEEIKYLQVLSAYEFAKNSVKLKQRERYFQVVDYYNKFLDRYPQSPYLKEAETLFKNTKKALEEINEKSS